MVAAHLSSSTSELVVGHLTYSKSIRGYIDNTREDAGWVVDHYLSRTGNSEPKKLQNAVWPPLDNCVNKHLVDWIK